MRMPPLRHARLDRHVPIPEPCRRVDLFDNIDPQPGRIVKPEPALAKGFILQRIGDRRARPGHLRSYGFGILFRPLLSGIRIGGTDLGFWFAQQGSIIVFVILIFVYAWRMNRLDRAYGVEE